MVLPFNVLFRRTAFMFRPVYCPFFHRFFYLRFHFIFPSSASLIHLIHPFPFCDQREQKASLPRCRRHPGSFCETKTQTCFLSPDELVRPPQAGIFSSGNAVKRHVCISGLLSKNKRFIIYLRRTEKFLRGNWIFSRNSLNVCLRPRLIHSSSSDL